MHCSQSSLLFYFFFWRKSCVRSSHSFLLRFVYVSVLFSVVQYFNCRFLLEGFINFPHLCASVTAECLDFLDFRFSMNKFVYTYTFFYNEWLQPNNWMNVSQFDCVLYSLNAHSIHITSNHMMHTAYGIRNTL